MIKSNINRKFSHHTVIDISSDFVYIVDYTQKAKTNVGYRGRATEVIHSTKPADELSLEIKNPNTASISYVVFDNTSFVYSVGKPKSQCESVFFPSISNNESWILFVELKYCTNNINNLNDFNKARKQLFKTQCYYKQELVFTDNPVYLVISIPTQSEPFLNISLNPNYLLSLKEKHNITMMLKNEITINNDIIR